MYINEYDPTLESFVGVLKVGEKIKAQVMKIDEEHGSILLSRLPLLRKQNDEKMEKDNIALECLKLEELDYMLDFVDEVDLLELSIDEFFILFNNKVIVNHFVMFTMLLRTQQSLFL